MKKEDNSDGSSSDDVNEANPPKFSTYRDFSRVPPEPHIDSLSLADQGTTAKEPTFPLKLHKILSNREFQDIVTWLPHGRAWRILQQKAFEERVIPLYFRHGRYSSFARQVNGWGFRRITHGSDYNSYYHELFLRGKVFLCNKMRRLTTKDLAKVKMEQGPTPDFYELSRDNPLPETAPAPAATSTPSIAPLGGLESKDILGRIQLLTAAKNGSGGTSVDVLSSNTNITGATISLGNSGSATQASTLGSATTGLTPYQALSSASTVAQPSKVYSSPNMSSAAAAPSTTGSTFSAAPAATTTVAPASALTSTAPNSFLASFAPTSVLTAPAPNSIVGLTAPASTIASFAPMPAQGSSAPTSTSETTALTSTAGINSTANQSAAAPISACNTTNPQSQTAQWAWGGTAQIPSAIGSAAQTSTLGTAQAANSTMGANALNLGPMAAFANPSALAALLASNPSALNAVAAALAQRGPTTTALAPATTLNATSFAPGTMLNTAAFAPTNATVGTTTFAPSTQFSAQAVTPASLGQAGLSQGINFCTAPVAAGAPSNGAAAPSPAVTIGSDMNQATNIGTTSVTPANQGTTTFSQTANLGTPAPAPGTTVSAAALTPSLSLGTTGLAPATMVGTNAGQQSFTGNVGQIFDGSNNNALQLQLLEAQARLMQPQGQQFHAQI